MKMYSPISFILLTVTVSVIKITVAQRLLNLADQDKYFPDWKKLEIATDEQKSEWLSQWVEDIAERCEQNGVDVFVALEIKKVYKCLQTPHRSPEALEYKAFRELLFEDEREEKPSYEDMCSHLNSSLECMNPSIKKISSCFESEEFPKEHVFRDMVHRWFRNMCKPDMNYENAMDKHGDVLGDCLKKHADATARGTTDCFDERTVKTRGIRVEGSKAICNDLETYQDCYIDALEICDNEEAEKLMYRMINEPSYKRIVMKNVYKCDDYYDDEEVIKTDKKDEL